ncbi:SusC/RagA family TonB-linked outer membrane protein [Maribacter polysaccharolyticus]|uniref:SusC/RagA family TonB-linked outer membrane protein n=1 Tax=Maribacter polysaccharolyticus TaxID=3020831 RepID=UPI00237FCA3B|nr:TonB-dependent receptor [Maribacter polysaccharolyticus]MDE3741212.1 TonB-dependent receptor [Maribacter polysaccharolyticus]
MRKMLSVLLIFGALGFAYGQSITVTGKVVSSDDGLGVIGATVLVKGGTTGTTTDFDGNYSINADSKGVLVFQYMGFSSLEVPINGQSTLNVTMEPTVQTLGEIVVVGYGQQKKEALTGAIAEMDNSRIEQVPVASFEQTLQGNMSGVQSSGGDGAPGSNSQIRIRGIGSISASSEPLYVIDGAIVTAGSFAGLNDNGDRSTNIMSTLNPNDIESISVLKDASATAIYGARGANGVILITTKRGKTGKPKIQLGIQTGFNSVASNKLLKPLTGEQYKDLYISGYTVNGSMTYEEAEAQLIDTFIDMYDPETGEMISTDWLDAVTRTGLNQSYNLGVSGATENVRYYVSGSYFDQESHLIGTEFKRLSSRANIDVKINENITLTNNLTVSQTKQLGTVDGSAWANPLYNAYLLSPLIPIKDENGNYYGEHKNYFPMGGNNPVGSLSGDDTRETSQLRLLDNIALSVKFLQDFTFRSQWNFDIFQVDEYQYYNANYGNGRNVGGYAQENTIQNSNWLGTQTLSYSKTFGDHHFDALIGYEAQENNYKTVYAYGENFPNDKVRNLASASSSYDTSSSRSSYSFVSLLSRANYDYNNKYFLSASIRRDGSSRFGADSRWGTFYSVGAGWSIHKEDFMEDISFINNLKLRGSYGKTGNAEIDNFISRGLYDYSNTYDGLPGGSPYQLANPELTWESQTNYNIGLDFTLLNNRLGGSIEYFNKNSTDLLLDVPVSRITGFENYTQNYGEMVNNGWEASINGRILQTDDFSWDAGFNITFLKNEITKLQSDYTDGTKRRAEGHDFQSFYLYEWAGVDQSNGDPLWYTDETRSVTTNDISDAERFFIGKSATPDFYGGFNSTFSYKGFSLDGQFSYSWNQYIYDSNERFIQGDGALTPRSTTTYIYENRWLPGSTDAETPLFYWGNNSGSNTANTSRWLHDASYIRLRNLTFAYNFDSDITSKLGLSMLRVYARGTNLLTITRDPDLYIDPEQGINGISQGLTPAIKSITLGLDLEF